MYEQWEKQSRGGLSPVGIENLKIAIVKQAADDYIDLRGGFAVETAECNLKEIKRFFHSDWYSLLSKVNPDYILEELERKLKKMELKYTIAKERGSSHYYVHEVGNPSPIPNTYGTKKQALHKAAKLNDLGYKDYMKVRRKAGME